MNRNFKDQERSLCSSDESTGTAAAVHRQINCQEQNSITPRKLPLSASQLSESVASPLHTAISRGTFTRVIARLRDGQSEQWVARKEHVTIAQVNKIRAAYFSLIPRAFAIFRMERENAQDLFSELEQDVLDQEVA